MTGLGKVLIVTGAVLLVVGLLMLFADRIPWLGKLPGDFVIKRDNLTIYIPITTMVIVSIILTVVLNLFGRGR
ncbi:DUF2905 family protein [candidate division GN15 bacterium]|nr:DUF2905 family protein [candidate division GN15 bacterium]